LGDLHGTCIAVWGLTYKPGTDTLRRSSSVELCKWLAGQGAHVQAHDPAIKSLPAELAWTMRLCAAPLDALPGADALVIATEWQDYQALSADEIVSPMRTPWIVDANRFLEKTLGMDSRIRYIAVGKAQ